MDIRYNNLPELSPCQSVGFLDRFFIYADKHPDKIAIVTPEQTLTYHAVAKQAVTIAEALKKMGVTRETPVAILLPPGIKQIISQLSILIANGSCVPLDPDMPGDRLNDMLDDVDVPWTIVNSAGEHENLHTALVNFDDLLNDQKQNAFAYENISLNHRTHILFTSGTTGKPKAVEIEAKGILRLVAAPRYIDLTSDDRIACLANPTFDASLFEVWSALLNGATSVIIPKKDVLDIHFFQQVLIRQKITVMFMTTSLFNLIATTLPQAFRFLRHLLVGGEALNPHTLKRVLDSAPPGNIINGYGPTENTTFTMTHNIQADDLTGGSVPIGKPIDHTFAFILDDNLMPVAQGVIGHLYIGGDGLARGYWNRDELNNEKFVHVTLPGYSEALRLYKTGDLSCQRADGIFMYHGRIDNQVKLRGHRIELEEIELRLLNNQQVTAASVMLVKKENAEPFLGAFIVPRDPESYKADVLDKKLRQYLPEYMLPRIFIVNAIPLTPAGKTDKRQLLMTLEQSTLTVERPDGFNDTEYALLRIWRNVLNANDIGLDDNFFQLGGSSLQAARLIIESGRQFNRNFSVQTLYDAPVLREFADVISRESVTRVQDDITEWLQDAQLPDDIQPLAGELTDWSHSDAATILLTGSTGFLGAFFLCDLLAMPNVKQVICLVRAADEAAAGQRIEQNLAQYSLWDPAFGSRITVIHGDLALPKLGLSDSVYDRLATESDVIFHLGAHVNYIQPYLAHRAGNIDGTLNILRLATQGKPKPLHYLSTIAVYGPAGLLNNVDRIYENDDTTPYLEGLKYDSGYSQSKWVVEQFVREAQKRGIPLSVYRPGFIMGDTKKGMGNPKDFASRLIRGCIAIGAYPSLPRQRKEFIPVDYVSAVLLTIAKNSNNLGQTYHLVPPDHAQSIDLEQFFELLSASGYSLQKLPYSEWVTRLGADPMLDDNPLMPLIPTLSEAVYQQQTRWEVYENMPAYDASNTRAALKAANSPLKFTPMDKHQLLLHLNFWQRNGFLPASNNK